MTESTLNPASNPASGPFSWRSSWCSPRATHALARRSPRLGGKFPGRISANQGGFTLIEVLVSVLILLVGMLGVVGMQMLSLQANQGAYFRSQAIYIGSEILDAMRSNPTAVAAYVGDYPGDTPGDPGCQAAPAGCTPADAADYDLHFWSRHFIDASGLAGAGFRPSIPDGRAVITAAGNEYTVQVIWAEEQFDDTDASDGSLTRSRVQQFVNLTAVLTP